MRQLALRSEEFGGELFVRRKVGQAHVLDRVAERPVPQVVQQGSRQQNLGCMAVDNLAKPLVFAELPQISQGVVENPQRMLEPRVHRPRINSRDQAQLRYLGQPAEFERVDQCPYPSGKRDILFVRNADDPLPRIEPGQFRDLHESVFHNLERGCRASVPLPERVARL